MSGITALAANLFAGLTLTLAPVPADPKPDPLGRGYLGVYFDRESLRISSVDPSFPGAKAGLRSGDVIVRINTLQAQSTQQVIDHVCSFRPGASIEMEVQRGSERKVVRLKLASRPPESDQPRILTGQPIIIDD
jgi:S1-C subfamily serine protease